MNLCNVETEFFIRPGINDDFGVHNGLGRKRRIGFGRSKAGVGIHRSEEILPDELRLAVSQTGSSISSEDMSISQDTSDRY